MARTRLAAAALVCVAVGAAFAQEDGKPSPQTVADAVASLASADAKRRDDAVGALTAKGPDAVPEIVAAASSHANDAAVWSGLERALGQWPGDSAADALSHARVSWPATARSRFDVLVHDLRVAKPLGPAPELPAVAPDIEKTVRDVLAKYDETPRYTEPNPDAEALAKCGRDAIPALATALRERRTVDSPSARFAAWTAADALALLVEDRDVVLVRRLLNEGCVAAARSLRTHRSSAALDALVAAVERDVVAYDVLDAIEAQGADPRADLAVVGWIERNPSAPDVGSAAQFVARRKCDVAIPGVERALEATRAVPERVSVARALADLGDAKGIDALVDIAEWHGAPWLRKEAGEKLNEIVGRRVLVADAGGELARPAGNFDEAAAEFRSWWNANGDKVAFDKVARRWRLPGDAASDVPDGLPDVAARVRERLEKLGDASSFSPYSPEVREIVAMGRDAVPELLRQLRDGGERHGRGYARSRAVTDALAELVTEDDVPVLARLLLDGQDGAARCLVNLHCDAARDALLAAMRKGGGGYDVAEALRPYAADEAVQRAVVAWLPEFGRADFAVGKFAELVAEHGGDDALAALRSLRDGGVREHARAPIHAAIARLGGKEGIEALVALAESNEEGATDAANALNAISGRHAFSTRTTGPVGRSGNLDEASAWFRKWWDESKDQLKYDASGRRWTVGDAAPIRHVGRSPPDVAAKVTSILAKVDARNGYWSGGSESKELVALGRDAIPALVERILASQTWDDSPGRSASAAAEALGALRTDADVEMLASLLRTGYLAAARSLRGCRDPKAKDALLAVVAHGVDDMALMDTLATMPADAATWDAVRAWLRGPAGQSGVWMGKYIEQHVTPEAAPVLREALAMPVIDNNLRVRCAAALVRIGGKDGIDALIAAVGGSPSKSGWTEDARSMAASRLNSVAGERIFVAPDESATDEEYAGAAKRFRAWWTANAKTLNFDASRGVWVTGTPSPAAAAVVVAPDLRAKAQAILDDSIGCGCFMSGAPYEAELRDPHMRDLIALGHDVVPFLAESVRRGTPWEDGYGENDVVAAGDALVVLAGDDDRATMLELLSEGRLRLAPWFEKHPSPAGRDALLDVIRRGWLDVELLDALGPFARETDVLETLAAWAESYGATGAGASWSGGDAKLAEFLATPASGGHAPLLADVLDRPIPAHTLWRIAAELAKHGHTPAVGALVAMFEEGDGLTDEDAARVAVALNTIAGTRLVMVVEPERDGWQLGPDGPFPHIVRFTKGPGVVANRPAAVARVRKWWTEDGERLRFDETAGRWVTTGR